MSIPMKGLSKRGSYNHLTDSMEFKYFNWQNEINEATYKLLASGNKPKPTIEQQRDAALKEAIKQMVSGG